MKDKMKILPRVYIGICILYIAALFLDPYPGRFLLKALPILIMAYLSLTNLKGSIRYLMTFGFLFSAMGDVLLDLDRSNYFVYGLASFALAQLLFAIAFSTDLEFNKKRAIFAGLIMLFTMSMLVLLVPKLDGLFVPVLIYIILISIMGICAAFYKRALTTVYIGAAFFILSDSMIAVNKFLYSFPYSSLCIMITYYIAQYKIGMGVINQKK